MGKKNNFIERHYGFTFDEELTDRQFKQILFSEADTKSMTGNWSNVLIPSFFYDLKKEYIHVDLNSIVILDEITTICKNVFIEANVFFSYSDINRDVIEKLKNISSPQLQCSINDSIITPKNYVKLLQLDLTKDLPLYMKEYLYHSVLYGHTDNKRTNEVFNFLFSVRHELSLFTKTMIYDYTPSRLDYQILSSLITNRYDYHFTTPIPSWEKHVVYLPSTFEMINSNITLSKKQQYYSHFKDVSKIENKTMFDIVFANSSVKTKYNSFEENPTIWEWIDDDQMIEILALSTKLKNSSKLATYAKENIDKFTMTSVYLHISQLLMTKMIIIKTEEQLNVLKHNDFIFRDNKTMLLSIELMTDFIQNDNYQDEVQISLRNYANVSSLHLLWDTLYRNKEKLDLSFFKELQIESTRSFIEDVVYASIGVEVSFLNNYKNYLMSIGRCGTNIDELLQVVSSHNQHDNMFLFIAQNEDSTFVSDKLVSFFIENRLFAGKNFMNLMFWLKHRFGIYINYDDQTKNLITNVFVQYIDSFRFNDYLSKVDRRIVDDLYNRMTGNEKLKVVDTFMKFNLIDII